MVDMIENFDSEFAIMQTVNIINGFYKDNKGLIIAYDDKKKLYAIEIILNKNKKIIGCKEKDIQLSKGWFRK
jgi:hypothetical protein